MISREISNNAGTFVLAACTALAPMVSVIFYESFNPVRLLGLLLILLLVHALRFPRVFFCREFALYAVFTGYMFLSVLWAPDLQLAWNTLIPAVNFLVISIIAASLVRYHNCRAAVAGMLAGFLVGAAAYTYLKGFPFVRPKDFSYNAIASMYLMGVFLSFFFAWTSGSRAISVLTGLLAFAHIVATTSIKTTLGVLFGAAAAGIVYFGRTARLIFRNVALLVVVSGVLVYVLAFTDGTVQRIELGVERILRGVQILHALEDTSGTTSFALRERWAELGLEGWALNPVFGEGVEAFRADHGMTSHSTPIDLLYNTGLIGFVLFYSIFASVLWRLAVAKRGDSGNLRPMILAGLVCYLFISLASSSHVKYFLGHFYCDERRLPDATFRSKPGGGFVVAQLVSSERGAFCKASP